VLLAPREASTGGGARKVVAERGYDSCFRTQVKEGFEPCCFVAQFKLVLQSMVLILALVWNKSGSMFWQGFGYVLGDVLKPDITVWFSFGRLTMSITIALLNGASGAQDVGMRRVGKNCASAGLL
jgi:hypothetical protein